MDKSKSYDILRRPLLTEKSSALREGQKKILVEVSPDAKKEQIVEAAKNLFGVDVLKVNTLNYRGKVKRVRQHLGKRKNSKRAYLTLSKGADVDLFGLVGHEVASEEKESA